MPRVWIARLHEGMTPFGLFHNLNVKEPVPYYIDVHLFRFTVMIRLPRRGEK